MHCLAGVLIVPHDFTFHYFIFFYFLSAFKLIQTNSCFWSSRENANCIWHVFLIEKIFRQSAAGPSKMDSTEIQMDVTEIRMDFSESEPRSEHLKNLPISDLVQIRSLFWLGKYMSESGLMQVWILSQMQTCSRPDSDLEHTN